jgi:integrase
MAAPLVKTRHPGIYKRGSRYVVRYRANGKRHAESFRTLDEALRVKRERESARDRGELDSITEARTPFREYAAEWLERYQGNGRRGFTDETRAEYRRDLARYAYPILGDRRLASIRPRDIAEWISWLCDEQAQGRRQSDERRQKAQGKKEPTGQPIKPVRLSDATVRRIMCPVRACFATARREGLIRSNPCDGVPLPHRPRIEDGDEQEKAKAMTRNQLAMFLRVVPAEWRLLFQVLASTGLRWSELAALSWRDLATHGSDPHLRVRRALAKRQPKGEEPRYKPPKSRHGKRSIPLDSELCRALREHRRRSEFGGEDDLVFPARNGAPLRQENVRRRVLQVAAEEAGVPRIGFHTFRHTCASLLFEAGRNVKQVQRWLGHHSPGFTLDTYVHLLDDGVGGGLDLASELSKGESKVSPNVSVGDGIDRELALVESAS